MNEDKVLRLCANISTSEHGAELIEYFEQLSKENYEAYKNDSAEFNELHKGYALCIDSLTKLFTTASDRLARKGSPKQTEDSKSFY